MTYSLEFLPSARIEWDTLSVTLREQFKTKLCERLAQPRLQLAALRGAPDHYKIKLRAAGALLVYRVADESAALKSITVVAVAADRHECFETPAEVAPLAGDLALRQPMEAVRAQLASFERQLRDIRLLIKEAERK